jgi:hypothetical protein
MTMPLEERLDAIACALADARFCALDEAALQDQVAYALFRKDIAYVREVRLSAADRVDLMVGGDIAVELKVRTSGTRLTRQVIRYACHPLVSAVVVAGTTHHVRNVPSTACGKPVLAIQLRGW